MLVPLVTDKLVIKKKQNTKLHTHFFSIRSSLWWFSCWRKWIGSRSSSSSWDCWSSCHLWPCLPYPCCSTMFFESSTFTQGPMGFCHWGNNNNNFLFWFGILTSLIFVYAYRISDTFNLILMKLLLRLLSVMLLTTSRLLLVTRKMKA